MKLLCLKHAAALLLAGLLAATAAAQDQQPGAEFEIRFVTYNVAGLPDYITSTRRFPPTPERFAAMAEFVLDFDIIALQENFIGEREIFEKRLHRYFTIHGADTLSGHKIGSGLYTFSRWPIPRSHFEEWAESAGSDALSHKGFTLAATAVSPELQIDVYNLHAQAGGAYKDIRRAQYAQLFETMKMLSLGKGRPIVLLGDFNCGKHYDEIMGIIAGHGFIKVDPEMPGIDLIFYNPNDSGWEIEPIHSRKHPEAEVEGGLRLSDHGPTEATLRFRGP